MTTCKIVVETCDASNLIVVSIVVLMLALEIRRWQSQIPYRLDLKWSIFIQLKCYGIQCCCLYQSVIQMREKYLMGPCNSRKIHVSIAVSTIKYYYWRSICLKLTYFALHFALVIFFATIKLYPQKELLVHTSYIVRNLHTKKIKITRRWDNIFATQYGLEMQF